MVQVLQALQTCLPGSLYNSVVGLETRSRSCLGLETCFCRSRVSKVHVSVSEVNISVSVLVLRLKVSASRPRPIEISGKLVVEITYFLCIFNVKLFGPSNLPLFNCKKTFSEL